MYRILTGLIFCVTLHSSQLWADVQVQGYLNQAAMENLAADPTCVPATTCPDGRIYWNTVANEPRIWDGAAWQEMLVGSSVVPDPLLLGDGSTTNPTYSFSSESGIGVLRDAVGVVGVEGHLDNNPDAGISVPSDLWNSDDAFANNYGLFYHHGSFNSAWNWNWYRNGPSNYARFNINASPAVSGIHIGPNDVDIYADASWAPGASVPFSPLTLNETVSQFANRVDFESDAVQIDADSGIVIDTSTVTDNVEIEFTGSEAANIYAINDPAQDMFLTASDLVYIRPGGNVATNETVFQANGQINATEGSAANPTYTFDGNNDGMYRRSTTSLGFSVDGVEKFIVGGTVNRSVQQMQTVDGGVSAPGYSFTADTNTGLYRTSSSVGISYNGSQYFHVSLNRAAIQIAGTGGSANPCITSNTAGITRAFIPCTSLRRLKKNITEISDREIDLLHEMNPVHFTWKESGEVNYGFIAEEVEELLPILSTYGDDGELVGFHHNHIPALSVAAIQKERQKRLELEDLVKSLVERIEVLEAQ